MYVYIYIYVCIYIYICIYIYDIHMTYILLYWLKINLGMKETKPAKFQQVLFDRECLVVPSNNESVDLVPRVGVVFFGGSDDHQ